MRRIFSQDAACGLGAHLWNHECVYVQKVQTDENASPVTKHTLEGQETSSRRLRSDEQLHQQQDPEKNEDREIKPP
jgi:hypothetical protein